MSPSPRNPPRRTTIAPGYGASPHFADPDWLREWILGDSVRRVLPQAWPRRDPGHHALIEPPPRRGG